MSGKKIMEPFGLITQREWTALIARGADLHHIAMFALLRVRADRDGITRDSVPALARQTNRSHDTVERLLGWLRDERVISQRRTRSLKGPKGLTWLYERRALPVEEWTDYASMPPPSTDGVRTDAPSVDATEYANEGDGVRKREPWTTQPLGDNPDVLPEKAPDGGAAFPSGTREGSDEEIATAEGCASILAESHHGPAFEGKRAEILGLVQKYPDRDIGGACNDLIEEFDVIRYDGKAMALLESFAQKAPRVEPRERERTAAEARHSQRLSGTLCDKGSGCPKCWHGDIPNLAVDSG